MAGRMYRHLWYVHTAIEINSVTYLLHVNVMFLVFPVQFLRSFKVVAMEEEEFYGRKWSSWTEFERDLVDYSKDTYQVFATLDSRTVTLTVSARKDEATSNCVKCGQFVPQRLRVSGERVP